MKISLPLKYLVVALTLNQIAQGSTESTVDDLLTSQAASATTVESETIPTTEIQDTQQVSCANYYLLNPAKALGVGLFAGIGAPFMGIKELSYAVRGIEPYEVTNENGAVKTGYNNLDCSGRWYHARQGAVYIVGGPLVGVAFFLLSLRSLNNPGSSF